MMDDTEQLVLGMLSLQPRLHLLQLPRAKMLALRRYQKAAVFMIISHITQKYGTWVHLLFKHQSLRSK